MNNTHKNTDNTGSTGQAIKQATDFHGAALIDEEGNEIPITEDMVQNACHDTKESTDKDSE